MLGSVTGNTGTIVLQQELENSEPIIIDASSRDLRLISTKEQTLVIDGSRITSTEGTFVMKRLMK